LEEVMAITKVVKRRKKMVATGRNHFSDEPIDSAKDIVDSIDLLTDKTDMKTGAVQESGSDSTVGSMRIIKDGELYYVELKTGDGWIRSDNTSASGFSIRSKGG
jgi:hypothetical protein